MSRRRLLPVAMAAMACLGAAKAQTNARLHDASTQLHEAWLHEVLDLDTHAAVAGYQTIAGDNRTNSPERWVAIARLAELKRLGVPVGKDLATAEAPTPLRAALAGSQSPPTLSPLLTADAKPAELLAAITARSLAVPELRPFTYLALEWARAQIDYGQLQWLQRPNQRDRSGPPSNASNERWNAADILRVELQGSKAQAEALRNFHFPTWKPPTWHDDAATVLAHVHTRLDAWLADADTSQQQKTLLRSLREAIDQRAATDPDDALALLGRLPIYADRLLEPKPPEKDK